MATFEEINKQRKKYIDKQEKSKSKKHKLQN